MADDVDDLFVWENAPEQQVGGHGGDLIPKGEGAKEKFKEKFRNTPLSVLAVEKESGEIVGHVGLRNGMFRLEYEVSVGVKKEFWGKGYATEMVTWVVQHAFSYMTGVHRIAIGAFTSNPAAIAVYRKVYVAVPH